MIPAGIDLGTTYSAIAQVNAEGIPTLLPDVRDADLFRTPSVVHLGPLGCLVGQPVENLLEDQPDLPVARHAKLALGSGRPVLRDHLGREWSAEAVNALILAKLRGDAEAASYRELGPCVITVPAQFGDAQRRGVRRAAELADLPVRSLVDEPVAAATYLASEERQEHTLLVYDLGGGTFDATVLRCSPQEVSVLATDGDGRLGGKWIDELIMSLMLEELKRVHGGEAGDSSSEQMQLRRLAEQTKLKLCAPGRAQVRHNTLIGQEPFEFVLTQQHFDKLVEPLLLKSLEVCERCLQAAGLEWSGIDQVLLVGGSSLIPAVRPLVARRAGKAPDAVRLRQPHKAVAFGAALLAVDAGQPQGRRVPALRQAISAYDLGVRVRDPRTGRLAIYKLIKRNSALPAKATKVFSTSRDDQTRVVIEVVQAKGDAESALSLGHFAFGPIAQPRRHYRIEVSMQYDREGIVHVDARDAQTGQRMEQSLRHDDALAPAMAADAERELVASVRVNA